MHKYAVCTVCNRLRNSSIFIHNKRPESHEICRRLIVDSRIITYYLLSNIHVRNTHALLELRNADFHSKKSFNQLQLMILLYGLYA